MWTTPLELAPASADVPSPPSTRPPAIVPPYDGKQRLYASYSAGFNGLTEPLSEPSIGTSGVVGVGDGVVIGGAGAGGPLPVSQTATPPWCEQVPERVVEKLYVPSLQSAVAPGGASESAAAGTASAM